MDAAFVQRRFGDTLDLGPCLVGRVLNLTVFRGYATLDGLATISAPDVFDQELNPSGTQRALKEKHAREALAYALEASVEAPERDPRYLPEILLNARDTNCIEVYSVDDPRSVLECDSFTEPDELGANVLGVRVRLSALEFPKLNKSPQISRVDGNHRLHGTDLLLAEAARETDTDGNGSADEYPPTAFALLIDVPAALEAKLFRDINGEHEGMEVAHLTGLEARIVDPTALRLDPKYRALYIATELAKDGRAFDGMIFWGGSKTGVKQHGFIPPVRINSLRTTIHAQLKAAPTVSTLLEDDPETLLNLFDNFWNAVRVSFPEAWQNKRDYILLQAVGLGAFAKFGGSLLDRAFEEESVTQEDFERYLEPVVATVSLLKEDYPGIAGAAGQQVVADRLTKAAHEDRVRAARIRAQLGDPKGLGDAVRDALGGGEGRPDDEEGGRVPNS